MTDDISVFFCKMVLGHDEFLSEVSVVPASHTTIKSCHFLYYLSIVVYLQVACTICATILQGRPPRPAPYPTS